MTEQKLTLRTVGAHPRGGTVYLATLDTDPPTWAYVRGTNNQGMALVAVMEQATKITWRSGPLKPPPLPTPIRSTLSPSPRDAGDRP